MAAYRETSIIADFSSSDSDVEDGNRRRARIKKNVIYDSSEEDEFGNISAIDNSEDKLDSSDFSIETSFEKKDSVHSIINDTLSVSGFDNTSTKGDSEVVPESSDESQSASNVNNSIKSSSILKVSCSDSQGECIVNDSIKNASVTGDSYEESQNDSLNHSNALDLVKSDRKVVSESCKETQSTSNVNNSIKSNRILQDSCNESQGESIVGSSIESGSVVQDTSNFVAESSEDQSISNSSSSASSSAKRNSKGIQEVCSKIQSKESVCIESGAVKASQESVPYIPEKDSFRERQPDKQTSPKVKQEKDSFIEISSDESDNESPKQIFAKPSSVHPVNQEAKPAVSSDIRSFLVEDKLRALSIKPDPDPAEVRRQLRNEIDTLEKDVAKLRSTMVNIDMSKLPDNGLKLKLKFQETHALLKKKIKQYSELPPSSENKARQDEKENILPPVVQRLPLGFGAKALETQVREKTLTEEALHSLHGSINSCPGENVMAEEPAGLRSSVSLMSHQKHAVAWMMWRETQKPKAGILADDMGLGKTLTSISLVLKDMEEEAKKKDSSQNGKDRGDDDDDDDDDDDAGFPKGGTLVVCPASLLLQWEDEIKKYCRKGVLEVEIHHGSNREGNARSLARNDIVITTYSIVRTSANKGGKEENISRKRRGILHQIKWKRILLDEAHTVRNHKSQQSVAVCLLMSSRRWALTGTPIHNKELDLYALLKFLKVSPFDDYNVWRRWVDSKNSAGVKRLNTVINAIMLRRTKSILQEEGVDRKLPEKVMTEIEVNLDEGEYDVYTKVLLFSKTLFAQFLDQRAEKEQVMLGGAFYKPSGGKNTQVDENLFKNHPELGKMFKRMTQMRDIKTHQILVLLLRLRQICCHPGLIKSMIDQGSKEIGGIEDEDGEDIDLLSQMNQMSLKESGGEEHEDEEEAEILNIKNPIFNLNRISSKINAVLSVIEEKIVDSSDKGIVVSQWSSMLDIIHIHLRERRIKCDMLTGAVPVKERMEIVRSFNAEKSSVKILLLSLTAGGVGLNLTGANHLFLVDLHWNPQLESQAFDRIYRVGQKKDVKIYKFYCKETIEERIKILQLRKLSLAEDVLKGSMKRNINKLTLDDLKSLFSM